MDFILSCVEICALLYARLKVANLYRQKAECYRADIEDWCKNFSFSVSLEPRYYYHACVVVIDTSFSIGTNKARAVSSQDFCATAQLQHHDGHCAYDDDVALLESKAARRLCFAHSSSRLSSHMSTRAVGKLL